MALHIDRRVYLKIKQRHFKYTFENSQQWRGYSRLTYGIIYHRSIFCWTWFVNFGRWLFQSELWVHTTMRKEIHSIIFAALHVPYCTGCHDREKYYHTNHVKVTPGHPAPVEINIVQQIGCRHDCLIARYFQCRCRTYSRWLSPSHAKMPEFIVPQ